MKFKKIAKYGMLLTEGAEDVTSGLEVEIDADGPVTVTSRDGRQYITTSYGGFYVPAAFLANGIYTFRIGETVSAAFIVADGTAMRYVESTMEEIVNMWIAVGKILERAERAEEKAEAARAAVEEFREGYRTE